MGFNSPLIRPAIYRGGSFGGGTLDSHDFMPFEKWVVTPKEYYPFISR